MIEFMEKLCVECIWILYAMAKITGVSYEVLNVILFIFAGPLSTLIMGASAVFALFKKKWVSIILFILGTLIVLFICGSVAMTWFVVQDSGLSFKEFYLSTSKTIKF